MKQKDIVYLLIAVVILLAAGYLAYTQVIAPKSQAANKVVTYEVVSEIRPDFNPSALAALADGIKNTNYSVVIDINAGVGNPDIFGK